MITALGRAPPRECQSAFAPRRRHHGVRRHRPARREHAAAHLEPGEPPPCCLRERLMLASSSHLTLTCSARRREAPRPPAAPARSSCCAARQAARALPWLLLRLLCRRPWCGLSRSAFRTSRRTHSCSASTTTTNTPPVTPTTCLRRAAATARTLTVRAAASPGSVRARLRCRSALQRLAPAQRGAPGHWCCARARSRSITPATASGAPAPAACPLVRGAADEWSGGAALHFPQACAASCRSARD